MLPQAEKGTQARQSTIRADVAPLSQGAANCPDNNEVLVSMALTEQIGERSLVDGACAGEEPAATVMCTPDVRWSPPH